MPEALEEYSIERPPGTSGKKPRTLQQRIQDFFSHIKVHAEDDPNGCDLWELSVLQSGGYPQFNINGKMWRGNRLMWIIKHGPIPDDHDVCHTCDTPRCLRDEHLFLGTAIVNMHDMIKKGRDKHPTGIENGVASFTEEQIGLILALLQTGLVNKNQIARHFGSDRSKIGKIQKGRIYKTCKPIPVTDGVISLANVIATQFKHGPNKGSFKVGHPGWLEIKPPQTP